MLSMRRASHQMMSLALTGRSTLTTAPMLTRRTRTGRQRLQQSCDETRVSSGALSAGGSIFPYAARQATASKIILGSTGAADQGGGSTPTPLRTGGAGSHPEVCKFGLLKPLMITPVCVITRR